MSLGIATRPEGRGALGTRIALARREARLTQRALAARVGVSLRRIELIERGEKDPSFDLSAIARATGRAESWFAESEGAAALSRGDGNSRPGPDDLGAESQARAPASALVIGSLVALASVRFFTEVVPVLPRAANFVDVPIFLLLVVASGLRPRSPSDEGTRRFTLPALLFLSLCVVSVLANPSRVQIGPALLFVFGFLAPLGVYRAVHRLWPSGAASSLSRLLVGLGLAQIAVVLLIDVPRFAADGNPDVISGTFGENAYQLVFYLLVFAALLAGIATFEPRRTVTRFVPALLVATLGIVFLAQYRALLPTTGLTVVAIALLLGSARARGALAGLLAAVALAAAFLYVSHAFPGLKLAITAEQVREDPGFFVSKRLEALASVGDLYGDHPRFALTGTGPGTYSSRAWQTFARFGNGSRSNVAGNYVASLTGGPRYRTDVSEKYLLPRMQDAEVIGGSRALTSPLSSYVSLLAEVGLLGFLLMVGVYFAALGQAARMSARAFALARPGDSLPALLCASAAAFFVLVQMALLDNWLEVTRVSFIAWTLLAVGAKEFETRYGSRRA